MEEDSLFFEEGDWVECKLNPDLYGIVVSEADFGRLYTVQLAGTAEPRVFHAVTLQRMADHTEAANFTNVVDIGTAKSKGTA